MTQELYINKLAVLNYSNQTYAKSQIPELYSNRSPQLVSSDNSIDFFSPPWSFNNWVYIPTTNYQYNGKNILRIYVNTSQLSGYDIYDSPVPSGLIHNIEGQKIYYHGLIKFDIPSITGDIETASGLNEIEGYLDCFDINTKIASGKINGVVNIQGYPITIGGILYGHINDNKEHYPLYQNISYHIVDNLSGVLQNTSEIPEQLKYEFNTYFSYGWLNGIDNITRSELFLYNQISSIFDDDSIELIGKLFNTNGRATLYDQFTGKIAISINDTIFRGILTKSINNFDVSGYVDGIVNFKDVEISMKGLLQGKIDTSSLAASFLSDGQLGSSVQINWLSGNFWNKYPLSQKDRKIIQLKQYNTLGRKKLTQYHSLYGQNLNYISKNFDIHNRPYMIQTWKIIKYDVDNVMNNPRSANYNENNIDLNTYINTSQNVQRKHVWNDFYNKPIPSSNIQNGYYCIWYNIDNNHKQIQIKITKETNTNCIGGPFNSEKIAQQFIKQLCIIKNLKLVNNINDVYTLEHTDIEV